MSQHDHFEILNLNIISTKYQKYLNRNIKVTSVVHVIISSIQIKYFILL